MPTEDYRKQVIEVLGLTGDPAKPVYGPNDGVSTDYTIPFAPDVDDLSRLYKLARERKVTTILEFGSGYSTAVLAHALQRNMDDFGQSEEFKGLRRNSPFELHTLDCSFEWLRITHGRIPENCRGRASIHHSGVSVGLFNDRICHYYDTVPNITPDLIYLDGPSAFDVANEINGIGFAHKDRTVMAADIARMEWLLLPGTMIVVDGRTNNARFLKANLQRDWHYEFRADDDVHLFELREPPLGSLNRKQIEFCLGPVDWI